MSETAARDGEASYYTEAYKRIADKAREPRRYILCNKEDLRFVLELALDGLIARAEQRRTALAAAEPGRD